MNLLSSDALLIARRQIRQLDRYCPLLAHRLRAAEHHIVDQRGVQIVALSQRLQHLRRQLHRSDFVERPVGPPTATRRPCVIENKCVSHKR